VDGRLVVYFGSVAIVPPAIPGLSDWRPLARGGFALVWQARQESLNRLVAVKVDQRTLDTEVERRRFLREAGAAGRMSGHPGIVTVHDAGILDDNRPFLVMELCPGGSLAGWLKAERRPSQAQVVQMGVRIADALAAAQAQGVLHRDVKPANILIDAYGHAGLADFGLASIPEPDATPAEVMEALTPAYAAPEVLLGAPATEAGDVYSLAATLYAVLAGRPPHGTGPRVPSPGQMAAQAAEPVEPIKDVPPALMAAVMAGLAEDPGARPSAAELRDRLTAASAPTPQPAIEPSPADTRRTRYLLVAAAGVVVLGVVIAVVMSVLSPRRAEEAVHAPPVSSAATAPQPSTPTAVSTSTPTPPKNFVDCSNQLGRAAVCPAAPECWTGIFSYEDSPWVATPQVCGRMHVYQTFAAVELGYTPHRKSVLNADPLVQAVCRRSALNSMLVGAQATRQWEVYAIPPQSRSDTVYRCIFGHGGHVGAYKLRLHR
jgi:serine/threonine protein kinase